MYDEYIVETSQRLYITIDVESTEYSRNLPREDAIRYNELITDIVYNNTYTSGSFYDYDEFSLDDCGFDEEGEHIDENDFPDGDSIGIEFEFYIKCDVDGYGDDGDVKYDYDGINKIDTKKITEELLKLNSNEKLKFLGVSQAYVGNLHIDDIDYR